MNRNRGQFGRLEDWNLAWLLALQDSVDHIRDAVAAAGKSIPLDIVGRKT
jgi:hypothetical protein